MTSSQRGSMSEIPLPDITSSKGEPRQSHVELCAGGGGLAYGLMAAGFTNPVLVEADTHACRTLRENSSVGRVLEGAAVLEADVRLVHWDSAKLTLLAAGAPCQPFSLGGKHLAHGDDRNLLPEVVRAARSTRPRAVLLENVSGLVRESFRPYFDYILRQLEYPELAPAEEEGWMSHDRRLRRHMASRSYQPQYAVSWRVLNAADYGVPQTRRRVFVVAVDTTDEPFIFPAETHSRESLLSAQRHKDYWETRGLPVPEGLKLQKRAGDAGALKPWRTVRDALMGLPAAGEEETRDELDHWIIPGARSYKGHSGSRLDWPSKTIKAGVHGVPGGENMMVLDDGSIRYYTLREAARIQTFPDAHLFPVSRSEAIRQIGNAVPCSLARAVAESLRLRLSEGAKNERPNGGPDSESTDLAYARRDQLGAVEVRSGANR